MAYPDGDRTSAPPPGAVPPAAGAGGTPPPGFPPGLGGPGRDGGQPAGGGGGRGPLIAVLAIVAVAAVAVAAFVVLRKDDSSPTKTVADTQAAATSDDTHSTLDSGSGSTDDTLITDDTLGSDDTGDSGPTSMSSGTFGDTGSPVAVALDGTKGFLAVGVEDAADGFRGAAWGAPLDLSTFDRTGDGTAIEAPGLKLDNVEVVQGRAVAVGWTADANKDHHGALLTRDSGGEWTLEYDDLDSTQQSEVLDVAGDTDGWVAVGDTSAPGASNLDELRTLALVSEDGTDWTSVAPPPLPAGWTGGQVKSITATGSGTAFPGFVAVGSGVRKDPQSGEALRGGIAWQSTDHGRTWKIVSDENFVDDGRDLSSDAVAADDTMILIGGWADEQDAVPDAAGVLDQPAEYWHITKGGTWQRNADDLPAGRSSRAEAVTANPNGGFAVATQVRDSDGKGAGNGGGEQHFTVDLTSTDDGNTYQQLTEFDADEVTSLVSDGKVVVFVGINVQGAGDAWYTDL